MWDDLLESVGGAPGRVAGIALALGAGVLIGRGLRPVAKTAIEGFLVVSDRVREFGAEAGESLQDLYAEARSEHDQRASAAGTPPTTGA